MILSDKTLRERIIQEPKEVKQARAWWEKGEWAKIGDKIVIDPFKTHALSPCCCDFSVGEEYISLRDPHNTKYLKEGEHFTVNPGETVLVLTEEYICLPRNVMAMVIPSARWIFEGTALYSSRVEPTWYGKLLIGVTNLAKQPIALTRGRGFCTCYFMEVSETQGVLTKKEVPHLGRTHAEVEFTHARPPELLRPEAVTRKHLEDTAKMYGPPWDVVEGAFLLTQKVLGEWIEKEVTSDIVAEATSAAEKRAFDELTKQYRELVGWNKTLTIGILTIGGTVGASILAVVIGYLIHLFT